jgi:hypothetical protein
MWMFCALLRPIRPLGGTPSMRWQVAGAPAAGVLQATGDNSILADLGNPKHFAS